jgi:integrase
MSRHTINIGSVYEYRGKLRVKIRIPNEFDAKGRPRYLVKPTPFADSPRGRQHAKQVLDDLYFELYHGHRSSPTSARTPLVRELFAQFLDHKTRMHSTERNYRIAYERIIRGNYPVSHERLEEDVKAFVRSSDDLRPASVNTYLRQVAAFFNWMSIERDIKVPQRLIDRFGMRAKTLVLDFTDEEIVAMLGQDPDAEFTRMLTLMVETGARPVDVLTLDWDQVDLAAGIVTWRNKISKRPEPRPVSQKALAVLAAMRSEYPDRTKVFRWAHSSLSRLTRTFAGRLEACGIARHGRSLKHLRTTFKRRLMAKGLPFEVQMYLMRHQSADVTLGNYTAINMSTVSQLLD